MDALPVVTHPEIDPGWLDSVRETIIEPALPIIDPHHHLWARSGGYFAKELLADTGSGHHVVGTVFVQCHYGYRTEGPEQLKPVGETEFVLGVVAEADRMSPGIHACAGIVGYADLQLGAAVDQVLEAHIEAGRGRFRGIRRLSATNSTFRTHLPPLQPNLLADSRFREGFARLARYRLSFDAWLYHPQLAELTDLARAFPDTAIVLDHVGGPLGVGPYRGQRDSVFNAWLTDMRALANCPNVHVKLGGLGMTLNGFDFHTRTSPPTSEELARHWRPYIEHCIELFGTDRCMFESNFPVDKGMCSYAVLWNAFKRIAHKASETEKAALFHDTAKRFYRLAPV